MTTRQPLIGEGSVQPDASTMWPLGERPERVFAQALARYNPGYMTPDDWAHATQATFGRSATIIKKIAYEIWKDWISRVAGEERALLPDHAPERKTYPLKQDEHERKRPRHRFIVSFMNVKRIREIDAVLQQLPAEQQALAVRLIHGGWRNYMAFYFRDQFNDLMKKDIETGTRKTFHYRGHAISFSTSPRYWMKAAMLVTGEGLSAGYHAVRARVHQYQEDGAPEKLQTGQKPWALVMGCHDSRFDAQTMMDGPGIGGIFIDRNVGGIIEDANDPMVLDQRALDIFSHAMKSGCKEIILTTHGRCGCVANGLCRHNEPAIPTMTIGQQVMHRLAGTIGYAVKALTQDSPHAGFANVRDYAIGLFDKTVNNSEYLNGERDELATEVITGLHRLELTKNFVRKFTASALNQPLQESIAAGDREHAVVYVNELRTTQKITETAYEKLNAALQQGEVAIIQPEHVIADVKVNLVHVEFRTLDVHLWNADAARFVHVTKNKPLSRDMDNYLKGAGELKTTPRASRVVQFVGSFLRGQRPILAVMPSG